MNREILFRGKDSNGEWHFSECIAFGKWKHEILVDGDWYSVHQNTIGQYTGLQDVNGVKIFEGDILQAVNGIAYVVWDGTGFALKSPGSEAVDWHPSAYYKTMEIIGNIHDNPERL